MFNTFARAVIVGAWLVGTANAGDHFILTQVRSLEYSRIDPLQYPGTLGMHVHNVMGASNFSPNSGSPDVLAQANCSSTLVGADKSSYWSPLVYYHHSNGSFSPMLGSTRIYYFLKPLNGTVPVKPFPRGFRMLAGPPSEQRPATYPPRGELTYDQQQAMDPRVNAIKWGCGSRNLPGQTGSMPSQRPYLPNDAPDGCGIVTAGIFFPSCSDGRLDSDDHFSHMAYPLDGSNGFNCPPSHSIKYPTIFLETFYFPNDNQQYRGANQKNWVLSNGDDTGLTMHADFINGWQDGTLDETLQMCNTPNAPEENIQNCAPLARTLSVDNANNCRSQGQIADEDVGLLAPISSLPGCNPLWPDNARTKPTCQSSDNVGLVQPAGRYNDIGLAIALPLPGNTSMVGSTPGGSSGGNYSSYSNTYTSSTSTSTSSYNVKNVAAAPTSIASLSSSRYYAQGSVPSSTPGPYSSYGSMSSQPPHMQAPATSSSVPNSKYYHHNPPVPGTATTTTTTPLNTYASGEDNQDPYGKSESCYHTRGYKAGGHARRHREWQKRLIN